MNKIQSSLFTNFPKTVLEVNGEDEEDEYSRKVIAYQLGSEGLDLQNLFFKSSSPLTENNSIQNQNLHHVKKNNSNTLNNHEEIKDSYENTIIQSVSSPEQHTNNFPKAKTRVGVDGLAISKSSEFSLSDWFNYWFRGATLSSSTFTAVYNPHKYIEEKGDLLPDRLSHDFYSRIYRFNKEEYVEAISNSKPDGHAPFTHRYEDCMQSKRGLTIMGTILGGICGSAFAYAKHFGTIINKKRYVPYIGCGTLIGFTLFRFVISPRNESCFEQIINQALSERIISKGYDNMMNYYKHNEKPKFVNWYDYELEQDQKDYLNIKMREHMLNAMKKAGCNSESINSFPIQGNELDWKMHLDSNFKREYPSHQRHFKFL